ncbi:acyl-CoA synthetase, partial [Thioclava sp. BHET1]
DMYISGGSNVYPREIEEKILVLPGINEVAVLGIPDPDWGEVGVAVCVAAPGAEICPADVTRLLEGKIARYKMPKTVVFLEEMPKSAYGKITKKLVREALEARGLLIPAPAA